MFGFQGGEAHAEELGAVAEEDGFFACGYIVSLDLSVSLTSFLTPKNLVVMIEKGMLTSL